MNLFIEEPKKLLDEIWNDSDVHIVEKQYSFGKNGFCLIDISLQSRGKDEDLKYIQSAFYRENIRRGNTLIEDDKRNICWGRKGTPKILDIKLEHLLYFEKKTQLKKDERIVGEIIFKGVNEALGQGKRIQLIKTQKVNGENAQVSYYQSLDAWIICSKNVSILARAREDITKYKGNRYNFAIEIANQWFNEIANLSEQKMTQLKELLKDKTIVGEYCGNPKYQHLIRYDYITIKWFAMVKTDSQEYCYDPFQMKKLLQHFGFRIAKIKNISNTLSSQQFYESLQSLYLKTAEAGLQDEEYGMQGSIVYFVVQDMVNGKSVARSVGAGKLKTLQYRFFRKIRQKMSRYLSGKDKLKDLIKKYKQQANELEKSNSSRAPFPQSYYVRVLQAGLDLVDFTQISDEFIRGRFISILKVLFYALYKKISIQKYGSIMVNDEVFMDKVTEIPFIRYNGLGCDSKIIYLNLGLPGMFKSYLGKKIAPHFAKLNQPYEILPFGTEEERQESQRILTKPNKKDNIYEHFYLDGCLDPQILSSLIKQIKKSRENDIYYKIIVIKDQIREMFEDDNYNEYPFNFQTIIMCYVGQHKALTNALTIKQKIENLKKVTQFLKKNANFNSMLSKADLQTYQYPFSKKTKIANIDEFKDLIKTIIVSEDEKILYNKYGSLIIRLQVIKGVDYLQSEQVDSEIEHLIKSSYPAIPSINFKKSHNK